MYLTEETRNCLEKAVGLSTDKMSGISMEEEYAFVKAKTGCELHYSKVADNRIHGRGNPLIARRRICTKQDVDKWIAGLKYDV